MLNYPAQLEHLATMDKVYIISTAKALSEEKNHCIWADEKVCNTVGECSHYGYNDCCDCICSPRHLDAFISYVGSGYKPQPVKDWIKKYGIKLGIK